MLASGVRMARDYNRGLAAPIRAAHVAWAVVWIAVGPIVEWATAPARRAWAAPLLLAITLFIVLYPLDPVISGLARSVSPAGDLRREIEAWQQFGAVGSLLFTAAVIWAVDPMRRRRLLDLAAAAAATSFACWMLKNATGRPRPRYGDPTTFLGPFGLYPVEGREPNTWVLLHPWQTGSGGLWSMPSSHTAAAAALAVFLGVCYPVLRGLAIVMLCVVGAARLVLGAHWPTDVIVGAVLGWSISAAAVRGYWGVRMVDWMWRRLVNRGASPSFPELAYRLGDLPRPTASSAGGAAAAASGTESTDATTQAG